MNKQMFIDRLRAALNSQVSQAVVQENAIYYESYIEEEIRSGRSEAEVLQSLGDPRLIARTILETVPGGDRKPRQDEYNSSSYRDAEYGSGTSRNSEYGVPHRPRVFRMPGWMGMLLGIALLALLLWVAVSVLSFLAPVFLTVLVVLFLVKLFRDWLQ